MGTCPHEIFGVTKDEEHRIYINKVTVERCALDMACVENCPTGAIEIIPRF